MDQLGRAHGLPADRIAALRRDLTDAERASGSTRSRKLTALATGLGDGSGKVKMLADAIREVAEAR